MNIVTIQTGEQFFLLSTMDDLNEFDDFSMRVLRQDMNFYFRNMEMSLQKMTWGVNDSIVKHQTLRAELGCNKDHNRLSPICNLDAPLVRRFMKYQECLQDGLEVLVNSVGGYRFMTPDFEAQIIRRDVVDVSSERAKSIVVKKSSKYINLENDPVLEAYTTATLEAIDPDYGYIVNLRYFDQQQLTDIFSHFVSNGGHTVHVYTTGIDVEQMYLYASAAVNAQVPNLWIQLNCGVSDAHKEFEAHFMDMPINVRLESVGRHASLN